MKYVRKYYIPGPEASVQLSKADKKLLDNRKYTAFKRLNRFVDNHNEEHEAPGGCKHRLKQSYTDSAKCLLQGFALAAKHNKLHGRYFETSSALLSSYCKNKTETVRNHIKRFKEVGIIVDQIHNPAGSYNNNYLIRLADWLIDDMYAILEEVNRKERAIGMSEETDEQKKQQLEEVREQMDEAIEQVAEKAVNRANFGADDIAEDTPEMWQNYLKKRFFDSG